MKFLIVVLCLVPSVVSAQQRAEPMLRSIISVMAQDGKQLADERDQCAAQSSTLKSQLETVQAELKALKEKQPAGNK